MCENFVCLMVILSLIFHITWNEVLPLLHINFNCAFLFCYLFFFFLNQTMIYECGRFLFQIKIFWYLISNCNNIITFEQKWLTFLHPNAFHNIFSLMDLISLSLSFCLSLSFSLSQTLMKHLFFYWIIYLSYSYM